MITVYNIFLVILTIIIFYAFSILWRKKSVPTGLKELTGPQGWPVVGNLLTFTGPLCIHLYEICQHYGPLFKFKMGCREVVILSSNPILSKTLKDMGANFSGRWQNIMVKTIYHDSGIIFKDKEVWSTQRGFVIKVLKHFGLGKQRSSKIVNEECVLLMKNIEEECGKVVNVRVLFPSATVNVIAKLVMNKRFKRGEDNFTSLGDLIKKITQNNNFFLTLILMYPALENFPRFSRLLLWCIGISKQYDIVHNSIKAIIDEHKKRFNIEHESEDLIDEFLKEQYQLEREKVKCHTFTEWQLIKVTIELFAAGYETTSTTLIWSMLLLAKHPNVQDKVYNEIISVIGSTRMPDIGDKRSLPYTQAVMDEIHRFSSVAPLSVPHRVFESAEVDGFFIPKNSIVFPNLYACHRDKNIWEKPFEFYPEHFLTSNKDEIKYTPRDELVAFGLGKRQCLGEALARMEFFGFLTSILQRFKVRFEKDMDEKTFLNVTRGTNGLVRAPLDYRVIFEIRT